MVLKKMEPKFMFLQFSESVGRASPYPAAGFQGAHLLCSGISLSVILAVDKGVNRF